MSAPRIPFITWMKAAGMLLIVYGHVAAFLPGATLRPIFTKQLGVAFFVFITGATLATETRPPRVIVVRRLFEVVLFAAVLALMSSVIGAIYDGDLRESNYLPLLLGANVVFNFFPANPTTWYVGTYIHLIVLAALLHGRWQPRWRDLALLAAAEIVIRAALLRAGVGYIGYMLLSNWLTVYALGQLWGRGNRILTRPAAALTGLAGASLVVLAAPPLQDTFPFQLPEMRDAAHLLWISASVTVLYAGSTVSAAHVFSAAARRAPGPIRFVADHTLLIFLGHMPVYYALLPAVRAWPVAVRVPVLFAACVLVPGAISLFARRAIDFHALRERVNEAELSGTRTDLV